MVCNANVVSFAWPIFTWSKHKLCNNNDKILSPLSCHQFTLLRISVGRRGHLSLSLSLYVCDVGIFPAVFPWKISFTQCNVYSLVCSFALRMSIHQSVPMYLSHGHSSYVEDVERIKKSWKISVDMTARLISHPKQNFHFFYFGRTGIKWYNSLVQNGKRIQLIPWLSKKKMHLENLENHLDLHLGLKFNPLLSINPIFLLSIRLYPFL